MDGARNGTGGAGGPPIGGGASQISRSPMCNYSIALRGGIPGMPGISAGAGGAGGGAVHISDRCPQSDNADSLRGADPGILPKT